MWTVLLLITIVLLQVLTLVIFGHPMGRKVLDNILDHVLCCVAIQLCKIEMCCHRWAHRLRRLSDHLLLWCFCGDLGDGRHSCSQPHDSGNDDDGDSDDDSGSDGESDPADDSPPPPPPSSGAAAVKVEKKATAPELVVRARRIHVRSRAHTPGRCAQTRVLMHPA